jgi:hypothetical protein
MRVESAAAAALVVTACVTRAVGTPTVTLSGASSAAPVEALVRAALLADAAGDAAADTLYAPGATVIANARVRLRTPRFAGVGAGGRASVTAATATLEGRFAWVTLDYRWVNVEQRVAMVGRATVLCQQREGQWRIMHLHSSQPLPWEQ